MLIPVDGGALAVDVLMGSTTPVLAVHGVSSNRRLWNWVHAAAPEISLIAPDLRGRAGSVHVGGPYSIRRHADDLVRVLDALALDAVTVCGMSLGGFVGVSLAVSHPERVRALICVDGGFPMAGREGLTPAMVPAAFAPTLAAVDREWPSVDEYVATHVNSLLSAEDPLLRNYAEHFLADGRVRLDKDAVIADATDVFFGAPRWQELAVPTRLVYAEWSVDRDSAPAYSPAAVSSFADSVEFAAPPRRVMGVDHGGIVMTAEGAEVVAEVLRETLAGR